MLNCTIILQNKKPFNCEKENELRCVQNHFQKNVFTNHIHLMYIYKHDMELNNQQWLICHKTQQKQTNEIKRPILYANLC